MALDQTIKRWLEATKAGQEGSEDALRKERDRNLSLLRSVFGDESQITPHYSTRNSDENLKEFLQKSRDLLADWASQHGSAYGFCTSIDTALSNLTTTELHIGRINLLHLITSVLANGEESHMHRNITVSIDGKSYSFPLSVQSFKAMLPSTEGKEMLCGKYENDVPWKYAFDGTQQKYGNWLHNGPRILKNLYCGKTGYLSEGCREEMSKIGWIIVNADLHPSLEDIMDGKDLSILAITGGFHWEENDPQHPGMLAHEMRHASDMRKMGQRPYCSTLLELRAFSDEIAYYERNKCRSEYSDRIHRRIKEIREYLRPYLEITQGNLLIQQSHLYRWLNSELNEYLMQLSEGSRARLYGAISK